MGLRLAGENRAGITSPPYRLGVASGNVRREHWRSVRRPDALGVEQVLDGERNALEAASIAPRPRRLGRARFLACALQAERRKPADGGVDRLDPGGEHVEHLDGRDATCCELAEERLDAGICEIARGHVRNGQ